MKDTLTIAAVQVAAHTHPEFDLTPLAAFQANRKAQVLDSLPELDPDTYEAVRNAVEAAYHAGWFDSRLKLGEL